MIKTLIFTFLIFVITLAQNTNLSGKIQDWKTKAPLAGLKIEISRVGDSIITKDTIETTSEGIYTITYPFEIIKYKKKYVSIIITPLDNSTHWFHSKKWDYVYTNTNIDMIGISNTHPTQSLVEGYVKTTSLVPLPNIPVLLTMTNKNNSQSIDTILTTDNNGYFHTFIDLKNHRNLELKPISNKWLCKYLTSEYAARWQYQYWDMRFDFKAYPIDTTYIPITGKTILNNHDNHTTYITFNDTTIRSDKSGYFIHYVPKGWSGTIIPDTTYHRWDQKSITLTNIQEPQNIDFNGKYKTHTISGYIYIEKSDSIDFAFLDFSEGGKFSAISDSTGFYSIQFKHDHMFSLISIKEGYTFKPDTITLTKCLRDTTIDIIATDHEKILISGTINSNSRSGIDSVTITFSGSGNDQCITDKNGFFSHLIRKDWSGTIIPSKEGLVFNPPEIPLERIDSNIVINSIGTNTIATKIITKMPKKCLKNPDYEIFIYNPSGRLITIVKNMNILNALKNFTPGLYLYQKKTKGIHNSNIYQIIQIK